MTTMISHARKFSEKFSQSWIACLLVMVQGDLSVITLNHAYIAAKTGTMTGVAAVLTLLVFHTDKKWFHVWLVGMLTMAADAIAHRTHFGPHALTEAVVTGIGAAVLAFIYYTAIAARKARP